MLQSCEPPRKPFHVEFVSSKCMVDDGYSNPMDFWANAELLEGWNGESIQNGDYECKLEQFIMPNNVESFNVLDLHTNKSVGFIRIVMEVKKKNSVGHLYSNEFHMPHKNYTVAQAVDWINFTIKDTWANIYTESQRTNAFGEFLVDKLCTGEIVQSSEYVRWNTHPPTAEFETIHLRRLFKITKRKFVVAGKLTHLWLLLSDPLRDYLGGKMDGFINPPPTINTNNEMISSTAVWELDCAVKERPFISFTRSTVPGPIATLAVQTNIIEGADTLNELCTCIIPPEQHAVIQLGLATGAVWKRVRSNATLKAIHFVITTGDGRRMPFKGGVIYYLLYFRPC